MRFVSTRRTAPPVAPREAILGSLAPDGGLYMPERIETLSKELLAKLPSLSFNEIAEAVAAYFFAPEVPPAVVQHIVHRAFTFDAPLRQLDKKTNVLELFHGPTLAFKDFGAQFLAAFVEHLIRERLPNGKIVILVATSGDTGSAVATAFHNRANTEVVMLYPKGQVSRIQEQQLTTLGGNVAALEVSGTFDDCQRLVKLAFQDSALNKQCTLLSANSINLARWIGQVFYYFSAVSQLGKQLGGMNAVQNLVVSVPSGNFGNITSGILAARLGLPVTRFVAATNANDIVPRYLETGSYQPAPSKQTISNSMDVGDPSNYLRLVELCPGGVEEVRKTVWGAHFSDGETRTAIREQFERTGYIMDPHTAVAYAGLRAYERAHGFTQGIFLSTAHPSKFPEVVEEITGTPIPVPPSLERALRASKSAESLEPKFEALRERLLRAV